MADVARECGAGWKVMIDALVAECANENVTVVQIKEKFGGLRFYTDALPEDSTWREKNGEILSPHLAHAIEGAECLSYIICEVCGKPGQLSSNGRWLKTVCSECAEILGYKTRVQ